MKTLTAIWVGALAAIGASLCCVVPLLLVSLGIGGAWVSQLTRLEPLRPYTSGLTVLMLVFAWHRLYRRPCDENAICADPAVQRRQRLLFWIVALIASILLVFPWLAVWMWL